MELRDEIGLELEAAKRRDRILTWLLGIGIVLLVGYGTWHHYQSKESRDLVEAQKTVFFAGHGLLLPPAWQRSGDSSTVIKLRLVHGLDPENIESLMVEDQRMAPESTDNFVEKWQARTDLGAQTISTYHDASVNAVGASCVKVDFGGTPKRIRVSCLSTDGRWKVTLVGGERDLRALDTLVEQFTLLEN